MNPQPLVNPSAPEKALAWYCDDCKIIHRSEADAARCCNVRCYGCGTSLTVEQLRRRNGLCGECERKRFEQQRIDWLAKQTQVDPSEYDGPLIDDETLYEEGVAQVLDEIPDDEMPVWLDCARIVRLMDQESAEGLADDIIERLADRHELGDHDWPWDRAGLVEALRPWIEDHALEWHESDGRIITGEAIIAHGREEGER